MNRTSRALLFATLLGPLAHGARVQEPAPAPAAQPDPVEDIVKAMREAEQRAKTFRLELHTSGRWPDGSEFATSGSLHVLRGAQPRTRATVEIRLLGELTARMDSVQTEDGIVVHADDPAFGEVLYRIDAQLVADLEWAGEVLARADTPGMRDRRAQAPLGSAMLDDLRRQFELAVTSRTARGADAGKWLAGPRRTGLEQHAGLPLADRVEAFVRDRDHALLEVVHHQGEQVLQRLEVRTVEIDVDLPAATFALDTSGQKVREVRQYQPMWGQIQDVLQQAEAKAHEQAEARAKAGGTPARPEESLRPSKR